MIIVGSLAINARNVSALLNSIEKVTEGRVKGQFWSEKPHVTASAD